MECSKQLISANVRVVLWKTRNAKPNNYNYMSYYRSCHMETWSLKPNNLPPE